MNPLNFLINYFRSAKTELKKITWPSRQETVRYSTLVIVASLIVAVFFATLDFSLGKVVDAALTLKQNNAQQNAPAAPPSEQTPPGLEITDLQTETVPAADGAGGTVTVSPTDNGFSLPVK